MSGNVKKLSTDDTAEARLEYLRLLRMCTGRRCEVEFIDGSRVLANSIKALRPAVGDEALIVLENMESPLGVLPAASLRAHDVAMLTVFVQPTSATCDKS